MRSQAQLTQQRFFTLYIRLVDAKQHPWLHHQLQLRLQVLDRFQSKSELTTLDVEELASAAQKDRTVSSAPVEGSVLPLTWVNVRHVLEPCCVRLASLDWLNDLMEVVAGLAPLSLADDSEHTPSMPESDEVASLQSKLPLWLVEHWLREAEDTIVALFDGIQPWIFEMLPSDLLSLAHEAVTFDQPELTVAERCALLKVIENTVAEKGHPLEPFTLVMAYGQFLDQLARLRDPFTMGKLPGDILSQWACYYDRDLDDYVTLLLTMAQQEDFTYLVCQTSLALQSQYLALCPGDQPSACDLLVRVYSGDVDQSITTWTIEKLTEQLTLILGPTELVGTNFGDDRLETCLADYQSYWVETLRGWLADDRLSCQQQLVVMQALRKIPGAIHSQDRELALFNMRLLIQAHWDQVVTHAEVATMTGCVKMCQRLIQLTGEQGKSEILGQQVGALFTVLRTGSDSVNDDDENETVEQKVPSSAKGLDAAWIKCWAAYFTLLVSHRLYECLALHWLWFSNRYQVDSATEWQLLTTPFGEEPEPSGTALILGLLARCTDNFQRGLTQLGSQWHVLDLGHRDLAVYILCIRQHCHRLFASDFRWSKAEFVNTVLSQFSRIPPATFLGGRSLSHLGDNAPTPAAEMVFAKPVRDSVDHWALYSALVTLSSAQPQLTQVWEDLLHGYLQLPPLLRTQQLPLSKLHQGLVSTLQSRYLPILQQVTLEACQDGLTQSICPTLITFKCALVIFTLAMESQNSP
ncbi:hypothetical protein IWQ62_004613 [Dispira parvispora]|uniref:Uncharacterized protein n=1 Tax=Dispira parvispora TaxID=1520584 RepID=A0A9W8E5Z9_9FUNG|nr:hypothetical protein IWQ62_004613 [Dispira parvispora]